MNPLIEKASPLYDFWNSEQGEEEDSIRLVKVNELSPFSSLYVEEPYKWEILYQLTSNNLLEGNLQYVKAFKILLSTLDKETQNSLVSRFQKNNIINEQIIDLLAGEDNYKIESKIHPCRVLKTLFAIFTNSYKVNLKMKRSHIYEYTGFIFFHIRTKFI